MVTPNNNHINNELAQKQVKKSKKRKNYRNHFPNKTQNQFKKYLQNEHIQEQSNDFRHKSHRKSESCIA